MKHDTINQFDPDREAEPGDSLTAGDRAARGEAAIAAWRSAGGDGSPDESNIRDAICDILHFAHSRPDLFGESYNPIDQAECGLKMWRDESHNPEE